MLNHCEIMGRLTRDPELRSTTSGIPVASFTLANETGRKRPDGTRVVNFIDVVAWRDKAEFAAKYLKKGRLIVVEGEISSKSYQDKSNKTKMSLEIDASKIHFSDSKPSEPEPENINQ